MKNILLATIVNLLLVTAAFARDSVENYSIAEAMALEQTKNTLGTEVSFYFGDTPSPKAVTKYGEFKTNKKTNAFNKSDLQACQWAFLSAMVALRDRALKEGGNAVINIKSNYKSNLNSSTETFQCGAGNVVAGVALVGTVVKIEK